MPRLVLEQPALARQAAAVAGQRAVRADHAMARHDDADRVAAVRQADGARTVRAADALGQLAVALGRAIRNVEQRAPHALLEFGADRVERDREAAQLAGEVRAQLFARMP